MSELSCVERAIVEEEEAWLARALASLRAAYASRAPAGGSDTGLLAELRDSAMTTAEDDLPGVLHELAVQHALRTSPARWAATGLPDLGMPYLAHLVIREYGGQRDYLLGTAGHVDSAAGVRIVDHRTAPIAKLYHRYREGESFEEELPGGRIVEGEVVARRITVVRRSRLEAIVSEHSVLRRDADGSWKSEPPNSLTFVEGGAGRAARPRAPGGSASRDHSSDVWMIDLDADQRAAVDAPATRPLLVLGSAGSGKTTVALHRLERLGRDNAGLAELVVPGEGLARLSRRLLDAWWARGRTPGSPTSPAPRVETLDRWMLELAAEVFGCQPELGESPALVASLKRHPATYDALRSRFHRVPANRTGEAPSESSRKAKGKAATKSVAATRGARRRFSTLRRRLLDAFTDRSFLSEIVEAAHGTLPRSAIEITVSHTRLQMAARVQSLVASVTDPNLKKAVDGRSVWQDTPDELAGSVDWDDLPILLSLEAWERGLQVPRRKHLVCDEAEDFSLFDLNVLGTCLDPSASVTLAGDEEQQTTTAFAGWSRVLETLGVGQASTCRLSVSYRCPRPVTELAHTILQGGRQAPAELANRRIAKREGPPISVFGFPTVSHADLFVASSVRALVLAEPSAAVAIIAPDESCARRIFACFVDASDVRLVLDGSFDFEPGVDICDVDGVKGLEYDYVVVVDCHASAYAATHEGRRKLHVAITRTSHQLWLVAGGAPSPLLVQAIGSTSEVPSAIRSLMLASEPSAR